MKRIRLGFGINIFLLVGLSLFQIDFAAAQNIIYLNSPQGDYIGGGLEQEFTTGSIATISQNNINAVHVNYSDLKNFYTFEFATKRTGVLGVRAYNNATRIPFQNPLRPGMGVYGNGRGCNQLLGNFEVLELVVGITGVDAGKVLKLAINFSQSCDGGPFLTGAIRFNSLLPIVKPIIIPLAPPDPINRTPHFLFANSSPGDYIGQGKIWNLNANNGIFTVSALSQQQISIYFEGDSRWRFDFFSPEGLKLGLRINATRFPFNPVGTPGMSIVADSRGCNQLTGAYDIIDLQYTTTGSVKSFAVNYIQFCDGGPALSGALRYNSKIPYLNTNYLMPNSLLN